MKRNVQKRRETPNAQVPKLDVAGSSPVARSLSQPCSDAALGAASFFCYRRVATRLLRCGTFARAGARRAVKPPPSSSGEVRHAERHYLQ